VGKTRKAWKISTISARLHLFGVENLEIVALPIAQIRRAFYVYLVDFPTVIEIVSALAKDFPPSRNRCRCAICLFGFPPRNTLIKY